MQTRVRPRPSRPWYRRRYKKGIRGKVETDASYPHHQHQPVKREEEGSHPCRSTQVETKAAQQLVHRPWGW